MRIQARNPTQGYSVCSFPYGSKQEDGSVQFAPRFGKYGLAGSVESFKLVTFDLFFDLIFFDLK